MNDINQAALAAAFGQRQTQATRFELLPIAGMQEAARALPEGAVVTVTCSPRHGLERTLEACEWLAKRKYWVVPHLAARLVRDRAHLERLLGRLAALGTRDVFVVGGDAEHPVGKYPHGLALLDDMAGLMTRPERIGVPAYPEGHPRLTEEDLQRDLEGKAALADYAVTQLCFEATPLRAWRERQQRLGLTLPVFAGIPGVMEPARLLAIALRLGLGPSVRSLRRQSGWVRRLLRPSPYQPDVLLEGLEPVLGDASGGFVGLHVFTFNRVEPTRRWLEGRQQLMLAAPAVDEADAHPVISLQDPLA